MFYFWSVPHWKVFVSFLFLTVTDPYYIYRIYWMTRWSGYVSLRELVQTQSIEYSLPDWQAISSFSFFGTLSGHTNSKNLFIKYSEKSRKNSSFLHKIYVIDWFSDSHCNLQLVDIALSLKYEYSTRSVGICIIIYIYIIYTKYVNVSETFTMFEFWVLGSSYSKLYTVTMEIQVRWR